MPMRVVVAILSCLGFIAYGGLLLHSPFAGPGSGDGAGHRDSIGVMGFLAMGYPLAYFSICLFTTFARQRSVLLRSVGIAIHTALAAVIITMGVKVGVEAAAIFGFPGAFFGLAWLGMYASLPDHHAA
jgi:hypothetical protein